MRAPKAADSALLALGGATAAPADPSQPPPQGQGARRGGGGDEEEEKESVWAKKLQSSKGGGSGSDGHSAAAQSESAQSYQNALRVLRFLGKVGGHNQVLAGAAAGQDQLMVRACIFRSDVFVNQT